MTNATSVVIQFDIHWSTAGNNDNETCRAATKLGSVGPSLQNPTSFVQYGKGFIGFGIPDTQMTFDGTQRAQSCHCAGWLKVYEGNAQAQYQLFRVSFAKFESAAGSSVFNLLVEPMFGERVNP